MIFVKDFFWGLEWCPSSPMPRASPACQLFTHEDKNVKCSHTGGSWTRSSAKSQQKYSSEHLVKKTCKHTTQFNETAAYCTCIHFCYAFLWHLTVDCMYICLHWIEGWGHRDGSGPMCIQLQEAAIVNMVLATNCLRLREIQANVIKDHNILIYQVSLNY